MAALKGVSPRDIFERLLGPPRGPLPDLYQNVTPPHAMAAVLPMENF